MLLNATIVSIQLLGIACVNRANFKGIYSRPPHLDSYVIGKWFFEDDFSGDLHSSYQSYEFNANGRFLRTDHFAHRSRRIEGSFSVKDAHVLVLKIEKEGDLRGELKPSILRPR